MGYVINAASWFNGPATGEHPLTTGQYWRIVLNQLIYVNQSEVLLGILLLYNVRVLERLMGSRKFLSLVLVLSLYSTLVTPVAMYVLYMLPTTWFNYVSPGPTGMLMGLTFLYYTLVPVVYRLQVTPVSANSGKLEMSDKIFVYAVASQLALGNMSGSLVQSIAGWAVASFVHAELIPGKSWRVPLFRPKATRPIPARAASSSM